MTRDPDHRKRRLPRIRRWLLRLGFVAALVYLAASAKLAWVITSPPRHRPQLPAALEPNVESVGFETDDGVPLSGWVHASAPHPLGTVLLFHGLGGQRSLEQLRLVAGLGFRAVAIDHRAHGLSGGRVSTFGYAERLDVAATVAWAKRRWPGEPLLAWGTSMGAAALCYAADTVRDLDGVVVDATYADIDSAWRDFMAAILPGWPTWIGLPTRWMIEWRLGVDARLLRPIDCIGRLRGDRTLLVTGALDGRATPADLERLAERLPGCRTLVAPGVAHDTPLDRRGDYLTRIAAFLRAKAHR